MKMSNDKKKRLLSRARSFVSEHISLRDPAVIFVLAVALSFLVFFAVCLIVGDGYFANMYFLRCGDLFMDHFNSMRDASQGAAVYTERGVIYPPMANLIYLVLSRLSPSGFNGTSFSFRQTWVNYPSAILLIAFLAVVLSVMIYSIFRENICRSKAKAGLFGVFALFNAATLYTLERGNIILVCLVALALFAFTYNSRNAYARELGLVALAFSVSIKMYPAMFFWLFLVDKRYKEFLRGVFYSALMFIVPSFFFGGPVCILRMLRNVLSFSSNKSSSGGAIGIISDLLHVPSGLVSILAYVWCAFCLVSFMLSVVLKEDSWKIWLKGIVLTVVAPPLTSLYSWVFFMIPITLMCNKYERLDKRTVAPFIVMLVPFIFLPFRINYFLDVNSLLVYIGGAVLSIMTVIDTVTVLLKKKKKNNI